MMPSTSTQTPLLTTSITNPGPLSLATLTHYLLLVRQSATEYVMMRETTWWPVIILRLIFNLAFIVASMCVMIASLHEAPPVHLRVWIVGYAIKCGVHGVIVGLECKRKWDRVWISGGDQISEAARDEISGSGRDGEEVVVLNVDPEEVHLDPADTVLSFFWWIIGFFWIYVVGQNLSHDSPQLYWLCVTFLVFDAFIAVIYIAVACVVGFAVCFCLPCMLVILHAVTDDQEEEIEDCIRSLPKYKFQRTGVFCEKQNEEIQESTCGKMIECKSDTPTEHVVYLEDAVCCICLSAYEDGKVLRRLPCGHHFHSACIVRWLYHNPTCPLCKSNVFNNGNYSGKS
ncbi:putative Cleavage and polyadenylation specificity factor [Heracleum sosnowskyi]|uniref:RING-type E3 ubiquitin transferase n=1 Tax=Heracleum sosnowskyi TaxID=360622 RepID=A0AAD8MI78_9APIA|nr:putative Cleavage and polyadenylation specificity factor [Heracleum sosnowskyi]